MANAGPSTWFVAQLRPNGLTLARRHLHRQGFKTFSPEIISGDALQVKAHKPHKPLFPGYLFVSFDPRANGWTAINSTRGVSRLILNDPRRPLPLPDELMAGLRRRCDSGELVSSGDALEIGDHIRVLSGPFADLVTQIETLPDAERVGVLIELLGREVRSSLPRSHIAKV
jgi:transcriptional antiterminator RfaH